jgi:hypothetical protein
MTAVATLINVLYAAPGYAIQIVKELEAIIASWCTVLDELIWMVIISL